jgi:hypothetical protein
MQWIRTGQEFLERLNEEVHLHKGRARVTPKNRDLDQGQLPLAGVSTPQIVFGQEVDLVICGPCSSDHWQGMELNEAYPMGKCIQTKEDAERGVPPPSWLHEVLKSHPGKRVIVFPSCCGSYSPTYQNFLRKLFHELEWIFPDMPDLADCFWAPGHILERGVQALLDTRILKSN